MTYSIGTPLHHLPVNTTHNYVSIKREKKKTCINSDSVNMVTLLHRIIAFPNATHHANVTHT